MLFHYSKTHKAFPHVFYVSNRECEKRGLYHYDVVCEAAQWCDEQFGDQGEDSVWASGNISVRFKTDDAAFAFRIRWC